MAYASRNFPPWQSVYYYFRKWSRDGTFKKVHGFLRSILRRKAGHEISPSVGNIDSQRVRGTYRGKDRGKDRGIDGGKRVKGRKRYITTGTQGLLLAVKVHPANQHDSKAAFEIIRMLKPEFGRMKKTYADGGYRGKLADVVKMELKYKAKITMRKDQPKKFKPLPKRWVVERTFAWWEAYRRLSREYEFETKYKKNSCLTWTKSHRLDPDPADNFLPFYRINYRGSSSPVSRRRFSRFSSYVNRQYGDL